MLQTNKVRQKHLLYTSNWYCNSNFRPSKCAKIQYFPRTVSLDSECVLHKFKGHRMSKEGAR